MDLGDAISKVRELAEAKLAEGENADEFMEIGEADGFKIYIAAGKTVKEPPRKSFHENPRDVFISCLKEK